MIPSTARMTMATTAALIIGSGSSNGIAAQLSLPNISTSGWRRRIPSRANTGLSGARRRLVDDALEQLGRDRAIGRRRHGLARLCQSGVAGIVERGSRASRRRDPTVEIADGHRLDDEPHLGKPVAAEICRKAGILARPVRQQVEMGGHPPHRVDLAAELRHEEGIHHRCRCETKAHRRSRRYNQLIDRGNALIGVDEQPFPVERHDVDPERLGVCGDRRPRIQLVRTDPGDPTQEDHDQRRDRPNDEVDTPLIGFIRAAAGAGIGRPVPPSERQGSNDHRNDDHEHDRRCIDQKKPLCRRDRPLRIQYADLLTGSDPQRGACRQRSNQTRAPILGSRIPARVLHEGRSSFRTVTTDTALTLPLTDNLEKNAAIFYFYALAERNFPGLNSRSQMRGDSCGGFLPPSGGKWWKTHWCPRTTFLRSIDWVSAGPGGPADDRTEVAVPEKRLLDRDDMALTLPKVSIPASEMPCPGRKSRAAFAPSTSKRSLALLYRGV